MQDYFKRLFVLCSSEMIFLFLIKKSKLKAIEIELAFFIPLGILRVAHWIISFMIHIQTDTYIDELLEIFLKLSTKTIQMHLIIGTTLVKSSCRAAMVR